MLDDTQVVEVSVEQNVEQKNEVAIVDVNGGVSDALNDLRKKASAQYTLQKRATKKLYEVLDGCMRIVRACEKDEDFKYALYMIAVDEFGLKVSENYASHNLITQIVFPKADDKDKRCYTYNTALMKAVEFDIMSDSNPTLLSTYLYENGGINELIRLKQAKATDQQQSRFAKEEFGTERHFADLMYDELSKPIDERADFMEELAESYFIKTTISDELKAQLAAFDHMRCFMRVEWRSGANEIRVSPYIIGLKTDRTVYQQLKSAEELYTAKTIKEETSECWSKYLTLCDEISDRIRKNANEKKAEVLQSLTAAKEGAK